MIEGDHSLPAYRSRPHQILIAIVIELKTSVNSSPQNKKQKSIPFSKCKENDINGL